jgi:hypothetical protein
MFEKVGGKREKRTVVYVLKKNAWGKKRRHLTTGSTIRAGRIGKKRKEGVAKPRSQKVSVREVQPDR